MQALGIQQVGGLGKYLGLPELFGRKKKDMFNFIIDRIRQRAKSWSSRFLSTAGKATMLKAVLVAMPTYTMSCFKLPGSLCKRIQSALTRFWWDSSLEKQKMSWIAWSKLAKTKRDGGIGFKDIPSFNDALLAKVSWRLLTKPSSMLAKVLLGKYCQSSSFLDCKVSNNASHGWRGICLGRDLLKTQLGRAIGTGKDSKIWQEPWISLSKPVTPMGPATQFSQELTVADLICPSSNSWIKEIIQLLLPEYEAEILEIRPSKRGAQDRYIWLLTKSGEYSAKTGYLVANLREERPLLNPPVVEFDWLREIWNIKTSPKIKFFLWKAMKQALPTGEILKFRGINPTTVCPHCGEDETDTHLFFHCSFASSIWDKSPFKTSFCSSQITSLRKGLETSKLLTNLPPTGLGDVPLLPWILWTIWISRNKRIFEKRQITNFEAVAQAVSQAREWCASQLVSPQSPQLRLPYQIEEIGLDTIRGFTDAAWKAETKEAGFGWHFSDFLCNTERHGRSSASNVRSPLMAEALAMLHAIHQARDLGYKKLSLASDSQQLIKALNLELQSKELYGILHDILSLSLTFDFIRFCFVPRDKNRRADEIAKEALFSAFNVLVVIPVLISI